MTAESTSRVSVIVRCFNEERHIGNLLESVFRQSVREVEVIVVDSGSTDGTLDVASRFPVRICRILPADFTFGFSLNQGCRAAVGDYLVIASAHVVPCSDRWLEELIAPFEDPQVGLVYGRQSGNHLTKFSEHQLFSKQYPPESNYDQQIPFCNNANAAIRRELWQEHPYDEALSGLEDLEWASWARRRGYRIAYNADAGVLHIHEESAERIRTRYMREAIALKRLFPDSHVYLWEFVKLLASSVVNDCLAAAREGALLRRFREIVAFRSMQYWGTYRGMNNRSPLTHELIVQFYYPRRPAGAPASRSAVLKERYGTPRH